MANYTFNRGKGQIQRLIDAGATFKLMLLKAVDAKATLLDLDTIADILANGSTDEADFTNYSRKTITVSKNLDDANDRVEASFAEVTWSNAGGTTDNTLVAAIVYHDVDGTDANAVPIDHLDYDATTDGNDLKANSPTGGFHQAKEPA